ncbi:DNA-directed RNA polymerase subunit omega [Micrococcales bacterium KH10]|nr:DNA-directed RNA polymerase subunit omega [Micrococcales bacterium KH10]
MSGTVANPIGITEPPIDELLGHVDSKYALVIFAAKRARQINSYFSQLQDGLLENVGPLVESRVQEKPLSIAMREINAGLLKMEEIDPNAVPSAEDLADLDAPFAAGETDFSVGEDSTF